MSEQKSMLQTIIHVHKDLDAAEEKISQLQSKMEDINGMLKRILTSTIRIILIDAQQHSVAVAPADVVRRVTGRDEIILDAIDMEVFHVLHHLRNNGFIMESKVNGMSTLLPLFTEEEKDEIMSMVNEEEQHNHDIN